MCGSRGRTLWQMTIDCARGTASPGPPVSRLCPGLAPGQGSRGAQQREVGRHRRWDGVHDDDRVESAQAPTDPHPAVGAGPAERPDRAREGWHLGHVDSPARHGDVVTVQPGGVEVGPGDEDDVVTGVLQVVGEHRRVGGDPAGVRVRGADDGDAQRRCSCPAGRGLARLLDPRLRHGAPTLVARPDRACHRGRALTARRGTGTGLGPSATRAPPAPTASLVGGGRGRLYACPHAERRRVAGGAALQRGHRHRRGRPRGPRASSPTSSASTTAPGRLCRGRRARGRRRRAPSRQPRAGSRPADRLRLRPERPGHALRRDLRRGRPAPDPRRAR